MDNSKQTSIQFNLPKDLADNLLELALLARKAGKSSDAGAAVRVSYGEGARQIVETVLSNPSLTALVIKHFVLAEAIPANPKEERGRPPSKRVA